MPGIYDVPKLATQIRDMAELVRLDAVRAIEVSYATSDQEARMTANAAGINGLQTLLAAAVVVLNSEL